MLQQHDYYFAFAFLHQDGWIDGRFSPKVVRIGGRRGTFASTVGWRPADNVVLMDVVMPTRASPGRGRSGGAAHAFLRVPFAASPFGAGRLRPPRPVKPWTGDREATTAFVDLRFDRV